MKRLPIDNIVRRPDVRPLNEGTVASLVDSIATVGLINPIRVREAGKEWEVIAGSHRLAACQKLGLVEIECIVVSDDDLHAELAMIDENLMRAELSATERSRQTARRKAIYLELHPETAAGAAGADARWNATDNLSTASFAAETAKATGKDERTVRRDAERGEKVIPEVMEMIAGTKLDTGSYLDKIKNLGPNEQVAAAKRDLAEIRRAQAQPKKKPRIADAPADPAEVHEAQVAALMSAWNKASHEARQDFLGRIDTPVFDRSAA